MLYAKSEDKETIKQHTDKLLSRMNRLQKMYGEQIGQQILNEHELWDLLAIVSRYHDVGKAYSPFQNLLRKQYQEALLPTKLDYTVLKHEHLSPILIPEEIIQKLNKNQKFIVYQTIAFHHDRTKLEIDGELYQYIERICKEDFIPRLDMIQRELGFPVAHALFSRYFEYLRFQKLIKEYIGVNKNLYLPYVLIKGLLNRLDHCASAGVEIEQECEISIADKTAYFFNKYHYQKNDIQNFCGSKKNKNILVIGSTGIGKTEAALLWSGDNKTFFTLPLIVSINAIYDRIKDDILYSEVGLLHSTSLDYMESKDVENSLILYRQAVNLSAKFTVCTIDQLFTFVFKFKGYEKIYATLAYSKVIIDEIQAYSPHIVAVILKGLEMIDKIGGKFMIMTATLPTIYREYLEALNIPFEAGKFIKPLQRHKLITEDKEIEEEIEKICEFAKQAKVLVIVNTVDKAIQLYQKIKVQCDNTYLLHARFIKIDKARLEKNIQEFAKSEKNGIWVTTQIVEASLDISFDYLFTELSTLDSLFQRMGRCYRNKPYEGEIPNIYVYCKNVSGVGKKSVYDREIFQKSRELIEPYQGNWIKEEEKVNLVAQLYSKENLEGTEFLREFNSSIQKLNAIEENELKRKDAHQMLREIESYTVIPQNIYEKNKKMIEKYIAIQDKVQKRKYRMKIEALCVNIRLSQINYRYQEIKGIKNIYVTECRYSPEIGLTKDSTLNIEDRMF